MNLIKGIIILGCILNLTKAHCPNFFPKNITNHNLQVGGFEELNLGINVDPEYKTIFNRIKYKLNFKLEFYDPMGTRIFYENGSSVHILNYKDNKKCNFLDRKAYELDKPNNPDICNYSNSMFKNYINKFCYLEIHAYYPTKTANRIRILFDPTFPKTNLTFDFDLKKDGFDFKMSSDNIQNTPIKFNYTYKQYESYSLTTESKKTISLNTTSFTKETIYLNNTSLYSIDYSYIDIIIIIFVSILILIQVCIILKLCILMIIKLKNKNESRI